MFYSYSDKMVDIFWTCERWSNEPGNFNLKHCWNLRISRLRSRSMDSTLVEKDIDFQNERDQMEWRKCNQIWEKKVIEWVCWEKLHFPMMFAPFSTNLVKVNWSVMNGWKIPVFKTKGMKWPSCNSILWGKWLNRPVVKRRPSPNGLAPFSINLIRIDLQIFP